MHGNTKLKIFTVLWYNTFYDNTYVCIQQTHQLIICDEIKKPFSDLQKSSLSVQFVEESWI